MPAKKIIPAVEESYASESMSLEGAVVDIASGVLSNALIFGPKSKVGPYYKGASGLYSEEFFTSLAAAVEGAWSWPYHPAFDEKRGQYIPRNVKDAVAKWTGVSKVAKEGQPEVRGSWRLRPKSVADFDHVLESPKSFAFSIFVPTVKKLDPVYGSVHDAVNTQSPWRPSVDLVEAGGANRNAIESVVQPDAAHKEETTMTQEEIQALIDKAVAEGNKQAESKFAAELAKMNRKNLVQERLMAAKLGIEHVTEALSDYLHTCAQDKIDGAIQARAKEIADAKPTVTNAGTARETHTADAFSVEHAVEVGHSRGMTGLVAEMAGSEPFGQDKDKSIAFNRKWVDKIGRRIANLKDKSPETKALRAMVAEQYSLAGVRNIFTKMYGIYPTSESDINLLPAYTDTRLMNVAEAAILSTSFTTLNNTILASIMIEAFNSVGGLVADQLMTAYATNKETENIPGFDEPTGIDVYAENAAKPDTAIANKYVTLQKLSKIGGRVFLTREAVFYDQTGMLVERANRVGSQIALHREHVLLRGIADVPTYAPAGGTTVVTHSYYPAGARATLWTAVNTASSNALATYLNLEAASSTLLKQLDSRSERMVDNANTPLEILVPGDLWVTAMKIKGAELLETAPGATGSGGNMRFANPWSNLTVHVSGVLNNIAATTWYAAGAGGFAKEFVRKITFPLEVVPLPAAEVTTVTNDRVAGVAFMFAERCFARDQVHVVKCISGANS